MSSTPLKHRRATIFVTGPHSKKLINADEDGGDEKATNGKNITSQDMMMARQRTHHDLVVVNTANSIEILIQIIMDEFEMMRHHIRENGQRMRNFFSKRFSANKIRQLLQMFSKSKSRNKSLEYKQDADVILNQVALKMEESWKPPRFTLNDMEEVMTTDDLESGVIQRRTEKWECLPIRMKPEPADDSICEFQKMNMPMPMTFEDDDDDRLSMPSTRTIMTTEDQMQAIQAQLAMLSKQLVTLQKTTTASIAKEERTSSSRASSRRGGRKMEKISSMEMTSTSSSSDISEDEGKGASLCSPAHSLQKKIKSPKLPVVGQVMSTSIPEPPNAFVPVPLNAPPPPPPLPPMGFITQSSLKTPKKTPIETSKSNPNSLPPAEEVVSTRPYLTDIANGRSMLKKTTRSPGGSPMGCLANNRRPLSSFEAALRDRFKGFHGDASFSEQEENDEDCNATWDE